MTKVGLLYGRVISLTKEFVAATLADRYAGAANGGTSETTLYEDVPPVEALANVGDKVEARYAGRFAASATATRRLRLYFAGSLIYDTGAASFAATAAWAVYLTVIRSGESEARVVVTLATSSTSIPPVAVTELSGVDFTQANSIKVTGQASGTGAATGDVAAKLGYVEYKPARGAPVLPAPPWNPSAVGMNYGVITPGVNVWQDPAGATPALADGDPVARFSLEGPDGVVLSAAAGHEATLKHVSGVWLLRSNGSTTRLSAPGYRPATATVVTASGNPTNGGRLWAWDFQRSIYASTFYNFYNDASAGAVSTGLSLSALGVLTVRLQSAAPKLGRLNGVNGTVAVSPAVAVGADFQLFTDDLGESGAWDLAGLAVGPPVLSDADALLVERYLNAGTNLGLTF